MRPTTIILALAASLAVASPAPASPAAAAAADDDKYTWNCDSIWMDPMASTHIMARCPRSTEKDKDTIDRTTLNLNRCLANDFGRLAWRKNGGAMDSCKECVVARGYGKYPYLRCNCEQGGKKGKTVTAYATLRYGLTNDNGRLDCHPDPNNNEIGRHPIRPLPIPGLPPAEIRPLPIPGPPSSGMSKDSGS